MTTYTLSSPPDLSNGKEFNGDRFEGCKFLCGVFEDLRFVDCHFINCKIISYSFRYDDEVTLNWGKFMNCVFTGCKIDDCLFYVSVKNCVFPESFITNTMFLKDIDVDLRGAKLANNSFGCDEIISLIPPLEIVSEPNLVQRIAQIITENPNSLDMSDWHSGCGTTHCLAGWATTIHPQGVELEKMIGTGAAGKILLPEGAHLFFKREEEVMEFLESAIAQ